LQAIALVCYVPLGICVIYPTVIAPTEYPLLTAILYLAMFEVAQLPEVGYYWLVWRARRLLEVKKTEYSLIL
jgi:hypothetical protein